MSQLNYYWRLFATGLSFASFGIGGAIIGLTLFPIIALLPVTRKLKKRMGQHLVHYSFKLFVELMRVLGVLSYRIEDTKKLNDGSGHFVIANHPTLIDVVFLISVMKEVDCIVKQQLWRNPFMIGALSAAQYISNGNDPEELIKNCVVTLAEGNSLIIFPEGTRSVPGEGFHFQRGVANIAIQANKNITPVVLTCQPSTLTKAEKWYQIPPKKFHYTMTVHDELDIHAIIAGAKNPSSAARRLTRALEDYYRQALLTDELGHPDNAVIEHY